MDEVTRKRLEKHLSFLEGMEKAQNESRKTYELLSKHYNDFYRIDKLKEPERTLQLSALLDRVKFDFNIPLLNDPEWNKKNPEAIELYKTISMARNL